LSPTKDDYTNRSAHRIFATQDVKTSNGKLVPEETPDAWFLLDHARFHILSSKPSPSDIFTNPNIRAAYEILSRAASDILREYARER
jgi:hypothetical protein